MSLLNAAAQRDGKLKLTAFGEKRLRWAVETGVGPLLFHATKTDPKAPTSASWPLLQSADLTAQVLCDELLKATEEIIDGCAAHGHILTLLKGISLCDQVYPEPHLRPMRDLDFLVQDTSLSFVESLLLKLGFRQESETPPEFYKEHHHGMPFFHPQKGIWVEVHRGLFPPRSEIGATNLFSVENIGLHLRPSEFRGRRVTCLSDELQIVYIACHWARDFHVVGGMIPMLDVIYLLRNTRETFRWEQIPDWVQGSSASTCLYVMLSYLERYELVDVPAEILHELWLRQRSLDRLNLRIAHALIDQYVVDGRTVGFALSRRNMRILWRTLLRPEPPLQNLMLLPWNLLPSRLRLGKTHKK